MGSNRRLSLLVLLAVLALIECRLPVWADSPSQETPSKAQLQMKDKKFELPEVLDADSKAYLRQIERRRLYYEAQIKGDQIDLTTRQNNAYWDNETARVNLELYSAQQKYQAAIFVVVLLVVAAGLWFSYMQFTVERRRQRALFALIKELSSLPSDSPMHALAFSKFSEISGGTAHSMELGPVKLTSNVVGLMVLALSLAFFNIFIVRVYTITDTSKPPAAVEAPASQTDEKKTASVSDKG